MYPNCKCGKEATHEVGKLFGDHVVQVYYCDECLPKPKPNKDLYYGCVK